MLTPPPSDEDLRRIGQRVMDELIRPLRDVRLDEAEYACLKTIVFFDPSEAGTTRAGRVDRRISYHLFNHILQMCYLSQINLIAYIIQTCYCCCFSLFLFTNC